MYSFMAKQHSFEVSALATDEKNVESQYSAFVHTATPDTAPEEAP